MLTFLVILGCLLLLNVFIFIFSRNKVEDTSAPKHKQANYDEEVKRIRKSNPVTNLQLQDAS